ncbi:MAG: hypothetical protein ACXADL_10385 [Candidatus Thorarchaeota archaeon]|jgi:hypothetical protein
MTTAQQEVELYTEESLTAYIAPYSKNITSEGIELASNIIGEGDGLKMTMNFLSLVEYAVFRLNGSVVSDSLTLKGFDDGGDFDTLFAVYAWADPYTEPSSDDVNDTYIDDGFIWLGTNDVWNGNVEMMFSNYSIEFLLLYGTTVAIGPGYSQSIDAIEVEGFTSVMADDGKDGIPDIYQFDDANLTQFDAEIELFGLDFEIRSYIRLASETMTAYEFLIPAMKMDIIEPEDVHEDHFYIMCEVEMKLPFLNSYEYLQFLDSYDLVNLTFIESNGTVYTAVMNEFDRYIGQDQRVRTYHMIDYTIDGTDNLLQYSETAGQIGGSYNTLETDTHTTETSQEKFDLDVSIVLDIVENVLDAVKGGSNLVDQFMAKILGFIQGKVMDGVGKALLEKITKKALKAAIKAIFSITTVKDIIVKGSKILEKLGVSLPSWLTKVRDFVESIPFIDPPVEIWKVRLTFLNESTDEPILGYDFENNVSIYTHPQGIYFGDTYSAQVILSSRDIFPVVGRIQSVNATRVITGKLYVEDFALGETTFAKSSLEPGDHAQGRMYTMPPDGSVVISQAHIMVFTSPSQTIEADLGFEINYGVTDENSTTLSDLSLTRVAVNDLPGPMIELDAFLELDGSFSFEVDTPSLGLGLGYHMVAVLYKPDTMFHDYWNHTFVLEDSIAPTIHNVTVTLNAEEDQIEFAANITDYDLDSSSVILTLNEDPENDSLATTQPMTFNGTMYFYSIPVADVRQGRVYYKVNASDNSGNGAATMVKFFDLPPPPADFGPIIIIAAVGGIGATIIILYLIRSKYGG